MEDDLEPGPETHPKRLRLNERERILAAVLLGVTVAVCILLLAKRLF